MYGGIPQAAFGASIPFAKIIHIASFRIFMQFSSFSYDVLDYSDNYGMVLVSLLNDWTSMYQYGFIQIPILVQ